MKDLLPDITRVIEQAFAADPLCGGRFCSGTAEAAATAALAIVDGMLPKWQPIETAPRDGTDVLVFVPATEEQFVAYFDEHGDWLYARKGAARIVCEPTHWMPLPEPPALTPTEEKQS